MLFDYFYKLCCIPYVDVPEKVVIPTFYTDLAISVLQVHESKTSWFSASKDALEHVVIDLLRTHPTFT